MYACAAMYYTHTHEPVRDIQMSVANARTREWCESERERGAGGECMTGEGRTTIFINAQVCVSANVYRRVGFNFRTDFQQLITFSLSLYLCSSLGEQKQRETPIFASLVLMYAGLDRWAARVILHGLNSYAAGPRSSFPAAFIQQIMYT